MPPQTQPAGSSPVQASDGTQLNPLAVNLAKAIRQTESGGDYNAVGDNGESHGAYQFNKDNFKDWASQYGLDPNDMSPVNQDKVAYARINDLLKEGRAPSEVAAIWNGAKLVNGKYQAINPSYVDKVKDNFAKVTGGLQQAPTNNLASEQTNTPISNQGVSADALQSNTGNGVNANAISGDTGNPFAQYATSAQTPPPTDSDPGLLTDLGNDLGTAESGAGNALSQAATGQINPLSGLLQSAGAVAGGITSGANDVATHIPVVGGVIKGAENLLGQGVQAAANTGVGQQVVGAGENFAQAHPELSGDIGAAANIAGVVPVFEGAGLAKDAISGALTGAGKDALIDAISPEIKNGTKAGAADAASNGTVKSGLLGKVTRIPDPEMVEAAPVVKEVAPKFMKLATNSERLNAIQTGIGKLANQLKTNLSSGEIQPILTPEDLDTLQESINKQIAENPLLVGDAGTQAQQIFNQFKRFLPQQGDVTMSDVLDARKKLDSWISNIKGGNVFDPKTDNAISVGLRAVRQGANDLMDSKVPEGEVKTLLRKQSLLYKVSDNLAPKASKEVGSTAFTRLAGRHPGILKAAKYAGGAAASGLGLGEAQHLLGGTSNQ